ncbi:hypothetical protein LY78DRAFT_402143 [Colletotrichum sublineola]|nr:hypothetical protein LY78DRAFT_402143 [Colletotrichum sublineola]
METTAGARERECEVGREGKKRSFSLFGASLQALDLLDLALFLTSLWGLRHQVWRCNWITGPLDPQLSNVRWSDFWFPYPLSVQSSLSPPVNKCCTMYLLGSKVGSVWMANTECYPDWGGLGGVRESHKTTGRPLSLGQARRGRSQCRSVGLLQAACLPAILNRSGQGPDGCPMPKQQPWGGRMRYLDRCVV